MANQRIAGVAYIKVDGAQFPLRGKWKSNILPFKREGIAGQDGVHGYKEMPRVPTLQGDISYTEEVSVEALQNIRDATITLELANGATHVLRNAWWSDESELDTEEGSFPVKFEGLSGEELR
ncbi:MAG: phage tail tube protein [Hyphomicrobiaceae bacterium]